MWNYFLAQEPGTSPGWTTVKLSQEVQGMLTAGPIARAQPNLRTGELEVEAGPSKIDISVKQARPHMESLLPAFRSFSSGGQFRMPHNLEISQPIVNMTDTEESKRVEITIVKKIVDTIATTVPRKTYSCPEWGSQIQEVERDAHRFCQGQLELVKDEEAVTTLVLQNPSKMILSVMAERQIPDIVCSEQYYETYQRELREVQELKNRWTTPPPRVNMFPYRGGALVYTGSLGTPGRSRRWLGLQPSPWGGSVVGRQNLGWGVAYQYMRMDRVRDMVFEYSPTHFRYTTQEYFGIESEFFVITNQQKRQPLSPGKQPIVGFTDEPTPRYHGQLGKVQPLGRYVLRSDTTMPERHTGYTVELIREVGVTLVHYGSSIMSIDRQHCPAWKKKTRIKVVSMETFEEVELPYPLTRDCRGKQYATFWDAFGEHSEMLVSQKFGILMAPKVALQHDQDMSTYAAGSPQVLIALPAKQKDVTRDKAIQLIRAGLAILNEGTLLRPPESQVVVGNGSMQWGELFSRVHSEPVRAVLLTHKEEGWLRDMGYELAVGDTRRVTVFPRKYPEAGWSVQAFESVPLEEFDDEEI